MRIKYQCKYDEFVNLYGKEEGERKYKSFIRGHSLEMYILRYGEDGKKQYDLRKEKWKGNGCSLEKFIKRHGEDEGKKIFEKWKNDTKQNLESFIRRYGDEEGKKRYEIFKEKSSFSIDSFIRRYGDEEGKKKFNECNEKRNKKSRRTIQYWIDTFNLTEEEAKEKISEFQNKSSIDKMIKKYGEEEGKKKYIEVCKSKGKTLIKYIELFGEIEGHKKWIEWKNKLKHIHSKNYQIDKHGEEKYNEINKLKVNNVENFIKRCGNSIEGKRKYEEYLSKKFNNTLCYSKIGLEFCERLYELTKDYFSEIFFGENEFVFFINSDQIKIAKPDFYIKDINLIVEFYGNYWHKNPKFFCYTNEYNTQIWNLDKKRLDLIKEKFDSNVIIIWESDYIENKTKIINEVILEIMKYKRLK